MIPHLALLALALPLTGAAGRPVMVGNDSDSDVFPAKMKSRNHRGGRPIPSEAGLGRITGSWVTCGVLASSQSTCANSSGRGRGSASSTAGVRQETREWVAQSRRRNDTTISAVVRAGTGRTASKNMTSDRRTSATFGSNPLA